MKIILLFLFFLTSLISSNGQNLRWVNPSLLFHAKNVDNKEVSMSDLSVEYLGSNKGFNRNYFFHRVTNKSTITSFDSLPKGMGVIFCTNERSDILWIQTLHTSPTKEFHHNVYPINVDDDRLIVYCGGGKESNIYYNSKIVNDSPQYTVMLFIDKDGNRINIPFHFSDTKIPLQDVLPSNITKDGTFAFSLKKLGDLTINNQKIPGDSGVYLVKAKIDFKKNTIDILSSKKIGVNLHTSKSLAERFLRFHCNVLEDKSVILSKPSSLFFGIHTNYGIDTVVNMKEKCYIVDKNMESITPIDGIAGSITVFTDSKSNFCFQTLLFSNNDEKPKSTTVVFNAKKEVVWKETTGEYWNSIFCNDNVVYLLKKNFVRHNLKNISYNFDLKRIDIVNKSVKNHTSTICDTQLSNDIDMKILSGNEDEVFLGYWLNNKWDYDWERGCVLTQYTVGVSHMRITNLK